MSKSYSSTSDTGAAPIRMSGSRLRLGTLVSTTPGVVRRHLWLVPLLAIVALIFTATWVRPRIDQALESQLTGELQTILNADVAALELWMHAQESNAQAIARDPAVRDRIQALIPPADAQATAAQLLQAPERTALDQALQSWLLTQSYSGYVVMDRQLRVLAAQPESLIGQKAPAGFVEFAGTALSGWATVSRPFFATGTAGAPAMYAASGVMGKTGAEPAAVIGLCIKPEEDFTRILNIGRLGETGQTYAIDKQAVLISDSRFDEQLKQAGLIPDRHESRAVLAVEARDPGVDLTTGERPSARRTEQPLTRMAQSALAGGSGVDIQGYRDFRGVEVIGAWKWLPAYGFGVATEIEKAEAYRPVRVLQRAFVILGGLLGLAAVAIVAFTLLAHRLERGVRQAESAATQLGQYSLESKIGEGGMGSVYRGRHALLSRPTAVKLLEPSKTTKVSMARFEREVQLTSQLNHPNTIAIYDYGHTPEGVFYYAMEFLDGLSLDMVVDRFGPLTDGRVVRILKQVCGSLEEAHNLGLIHRDIKPPNIMLTRRGGMPDFVKLLDFGVAKAFEGEQREQKGLTSADAVMGTPTYMAPESVQEPETVGAAADLYSLGAVGYFLLTGQMVFDGEHVMEILRKHVYDPPVPPSQRTSQTISPDLERLILKCLSKKAADRPVSASAMAEALGQCQVLHAWTDRDAHHWWDKLSAAREQGLPPDSPTGAVLVPKSKTGSLDETAMMAMGETS